MTAKQLVFLREVSNSSLLHHQSKFWLRPNANQNRLHHFGQDGEGIDFVGHLLPSVFLLGRFPLTYFQNRRLQEILQTGTKEKKKQYQQSRKGLDLLTSFLLLFMTCCSLHFLQGHCRDSKKSKNLPNVVPDRNKNLIKMISSPH